MATKVVNVKVKHIRPKYHDLKEWCEDPKNVYIARGGIVFITGDDGKKRRYPPHDSIFANPYKVGDDRESAIEKYRRHIHEKIDSGEIMQNDLDSLRGKNLGCWCKPDACHGDVLLEILEEASSAKASKVSPDGYLLDDDGYVVVKFV